jgi:uncharacterized protein (TIGR03083 family)
VSRLQRHVAFLHGRVAIGLRSGDTESWFRRDENLPQPPNDAIAETYAANLAKVVETLGTIDPGAPAWTLTSPTGTARFWSRRLTHETTIHRWDVEQAVGIVPTPIEADQAVDGIDEVLTVFFPQAIESGSSGETVHLHATDADSEHLVVLGSSGLTITRAHEKADVALRGPASDLLLWMWGRKPLEDLEVFGDPDLASRFRGLGNL